MTVSVPCPGSVGGGGCPFGQSCILPPHPICPRRGSQIHRAPDPLSQAPLKTAVPDAAAAGESGGRRLPSLPGPTGDPPRRPVLQRADGEWPNANVQGLDVRSTIDMVTPSVIVIGGGGGGGSAARAATGRA